MRTPIYWTLIDDSDRTHVITLECALTGTIAAHLHVDTMPLNDDCVEFSSLYVCPEYRRQGMASRLLEFGERRYRQYDVQLVPAGHTDDGDMTDEELAAMYRRRGYSPRSSHPAASWVKPAPAPSTQA